MSKVLFILNGAPYGKESTYAWPGCRPARRPEPELAPGSHKGTLDELADWSVWAEKVLVF